MAFGSVLIAMAAIQGAQTPPAQTSDFRDANLNIAFTYPNRWKITKKDKREVRFEIPFGAGTRSGELVVIRTGFRGQPEDWQSLQKTTNELSNRAIVRQWTQDLLGAPLLLTQVNFDEKGDSMTMTSGLFYTNVPSKMLFHLKVPVSMQDQMAFEWQQTLESFRTLDGSNLASEDPSKPVVARKPVDTVAPRRPVPDPTTKATKIVSARVRQFEVSGRKLEVTLPEGWTYGEIATSKFSVMDPRTKLSVAFDLQLRVDSESPEVWLLGWAAKDLARFSTVASREDAEAVPTKLATSYGYTIRTGASISVVTKDSAFWSAAGYVSSADGYLKGIPTLSAEPDPIAKDNAAVTKERIRAFKSLLTGTQLKTIP
jgi:hypothetical protein